MTTALFEGLFDDAALFPPGDAPMAAAVPAHRGLRARLGGLVGPFVVPAARLGELTEHLGDSDPFDVSVITPAGDLQAAAAAAEAVRVLDDVLPAEVPAAVEVSRTDARDAVLDVLAGTHYRAKLRTGGLRAELFPSAAELAGTLAACARRGVPVKCTAGLHSAVAHTDPATGFAHHGFLNLLLAADAVTSDGPAEQWLAETGADALVASLRTWDAGRGARARALFTSFGTCSVTEPVDDLVSLGLLPAPERIPA